MEVFKNETTDGNELAIRRGKTVPDGAINLAYAKTSGLSPAKNVVIVDTSRIVEENAMNQVGRKKLMFANSLGVLEDIHGNQLVEDEYPIVTDVFSVDEDWSTLPGSEYGDEDILPFVHVSRYFHVDFAGLTMGSDLFDYKTDLIKIIDSNGRTYVDEEGNPRYRIKITAARNTQPTGNQSAYRVHAYVDADLNEELYLTYSKIEVSINGALKNQEVGYKELLNPQPFFEYRPEESEVIDPFNRNEKWYSSKPLSLRNQVLGMPSPDVQGYKVYVPKKAIEDPRIFQLFRWRVTCEFTQNFQLDRAIDAQETVRCGVIVTADDPISRSPYAFLNLEKSFWNAAQCRFINPLKATHNDTEKQKAVYWTINFDTVTTDQLKQFDILIWAPSKPNISLTEYSGKINHFTETLGKTLFIDTNSYTVAEDLGTVEVSAAPNPTSGTTQNTSPTTTSTGSVSVNTVTLPTATHPLIDTSTLGGWNLADSISTTIRNSLSFLQKTALPQSYSQYIESAPDWDVIVQGIKNDVSAAVKAVTIAKRTEAGNLILSTMGHLKTANALIDTTTSYKVVSENTGAESHKTDNYTRYVNSVHVEGAQKLLFNAVVLAVKNKPLTDGFESDFASSWTFSTNWFSSWVINADNNVLSETEKAKHGFVYLPKDVNTPTPVWQRKLSNKTVNQLINESLTPDMVRRVGGANRAYVIEHTNSNVSVPTTLGANSYPYGWTEVWTPKFVVPPEVGAHIIKEDEIEGEYEAGQYIHRQYPEKPYKGQTRGIYHITSEWGQDEATTWELSGTATLETTITKTTPPSSSTNKSEITLSWATHGTGQTFVQQSFPYFGYPQENGLDHWQNWNYHTGAWGPGHLNWNFWGFTERYQQGTTGGVVSFIQDAMNHFHSLGYFTLPGGAYLAVDGIYGPKTHNGVYAFQTTFHARYLDGVVDAETWSIIGSQIIRSGRADGYYAWARDRAKKRHMSDTNRNSMWGKRSWVTGGPSIIWDLLGVVFTQQYDIHGVTVIPYIEGQTPTMMVRSVDIRSMPFNLGNYDSQSSMLKELPYRPRDNESLYIPFSPRRGDFVIIGMGQDGPAWNTSRMFGVRDILAHTSVSTTSTTPGDTIITKQTKTINISMSGTAKVSTGIDTVINPQYKYTGSGQISNIQWNSVTSSNNKVEATLNAGPQIVLRHNLVNNNVTTGATFGQLLPDTNFTYYAMDEEGRINPVPEKGWISKADGIKLLCDANGNPVGFPGQPTATGSNVVSRYFSKLSLITYGNDATVQMGFYDKLRQEFVVNASGQPEMSYNDYEDRGPNNVYIGVIATYEIATQKPLPPADDAPKLPHRWAMPVYGVYKRAGAKITLEPLPKHLGSKDLWPVAVRTGRFDRRVQIRAATEGPLTGYLKNYQGTLVTAFYGIPEADQVGWSTLYGEPNADIVNEEPIILDDNVLQVRQAPFLVVREPAVFSSMADPHRPIFKVYRRATVNSAWVALNWTEIADYNVSTGEIFLKTPMTESDPSLWRVDYTTSRRHYYFKKYGSTLLNLNPYPGHIRNMIGTAIYIYIVPEYVKDKDQVLITGSVQQRTLRFTTSPEIFDPIRPEYDPLAIQLGVVYATTALDISDLVLLDSRRRGGGARDGMSSEEVIGLIKEASTYWDIGYGAGMSYQKGGFVIIRLPEEMKEDFTEQEIVASIDRNITAGVRYKIEDLNGNDWA